MNKDQIRKTLESGSNHPLPLLQRLVSEGDEEGARLVAELGPEYLRGAERLQFRNLVKHHVPEALETEDAQRSKRSRETQQRREQSAGEVLKRRAAEKRSRRTDAPLPTGGNWNTPISRQR